MPGYLVILFALGLALGVKETLHIPRKPFNCMKCLTGWFSFFIALGFGTDYWYFYLGLGLLAGALFDSIKMRYL
jgi:hypothetical protein